MLPCKLQLNDTFKQCTSLRDSHDAWLYCTTQQPSLHWYTSEILTYTSDNCGGQAVGWNQFMKLRTTVACTLFATKLVWRQDNYTVTWLYTAVQEVALGIHTLQNKGLIQSHI